MVRIGIDTGGTFTDFVVEEDGKTRSFKLPSTPDSPEKAVLEGLSRIFSEKDPPPFLIQLGTTVATNALLERKGARTILVTTHGFEDLVEIGRQNRPRLYELSASRPAALVPAGLRLGLKERTLWDGSILIPLERKSLDWLLSRVKELEPESLAVCLLYSYINPGHELQVGEALQSLEVPVSLSHEILPEFREYERTSATVINAYVAPIMTRYLSALTSHPLVQKGRLSIMQSSGGTTSTQGAGFHAVRTLLSGPAGGVVGAFERARAAGYNRIITVDMGGTSTDVCLCDGGIQTTHEASIDFFPLAVQTLNVHTVGAGGGSIAWIDAGGLLRVGPQSTGADPGPACYGKGTRPTVTDAHLLLSHMEPDFFLGGDFQLSPELVRPILDNLARDLERITGRRWDPREVAEGILAIVNTQMEGALRVISLQKGYDTRDFTLVSFGGAGGLHACELARRLLIPRILIPSDPGLLSAWGILGSAVVKDASLTVMMQARGEVFEKRLEEAFAPLMEKAQRELLAEGFSAEELALRKSVDARYTGQSYELNLDLGPSLLERFHRLHEQTYGYSTPRGPVEIVHLRVRGEAVYPQAEIPRLPLEGKEFPPQSLLQEKQVSFEGRPFATAFYVRSQLRPGNRITGPAVILEYSATTLIPPDFTASVDDQLNLLIEPRR